MLKPVAFVYGDELTSHKLSDTHPMKPVRLRHTYELLNSYKVFSKKSNILVPPRYSIEKEILLYHDKEYLEFIKNIDGSHVLGDGLKFGLGTSDNPIFPGIYRAASLSTGATMKAVDMMLKDEVDYAMSISGGLHHAMPGYASGFCIFNDPVIAIKRFLSQGLKVAYVDIDCHHGDGVQHAFYDTDAVLNISIHESGSFLFPGTGFTDEIGNGKGRNYSVNIPLYPYTMDSTYFWAFESTVLPLLDTFKPDVLVSQLGIDTHFSDPITHLCLTVQGFSKIIERFIGKAPKWLALGGGGYDVEAVARSWASGFGIMSGDKLKNTIPNSYSKNGHQDTLFDDMIFDQKDSIRKKTQIFAEESVYAIKSRLFGFHGISG